MRAPIIALAAVLALVPAAALAQLTPAQQRALDAERARQAQENLRLYQQTQPALNEAERRLDDLDQRVRTQQNLDAVTANSQPNYKPMDVQTGQVTGDSVIDLNAQSALMAKELSAENERLRKYNK